MYTELNSSATKLTLDGQKSALPSAATCFFICFVMYMQALHPKQRTETVNSRQKNKGKQEQEDTTQATRTDTSAIKVLAKCIQISQAHYLIHFEQALLLFEDLQAAGPISATLLMQHSLNQLNQACQQCYKSKEPLFCAIQISPSQYSRFFPSRNELINQFDDRLQAYATSLERNTDELYNIQVIAKRGYVILLRHNKVICNYFKRERKVFSFVCFSLQFYRIT